MTLSWTFCLKHDSLPNLDAEWRAKQLYIYIVTDYYEIFLTNMQNVCNVFVCWCHSEISRHVSVVTSWIDHPRLYHLHVNHFPRSFQREKEFRFSCIIYDLLNHQCYSGFALIEVNHIFTSLQDRKELFSFSYLHVSLMHELDGTGWLSQFDFHVCEYEDSFRRPSTECMSDNYFTSQQDAFSSYEMMAQRTCLLRHSMSLVWKNNLNDVI